MLNLNNLSFRTDVFPFIIATLGEFAALFLWLRFVRDGEILLAAIVLWTGFLVERIAVVLWMNYVYRSLAGAPADQLPLKTGAIVLFGITLSEILIWLLWVWIAIEVNAILGLIVLNVLLLIEHSVEMAILKEEKPLAYIGDPKTIIFTLFEGVSAAIWLELALNGQEILGGAIMLAGLSVEHVLQGAMLKPKADDITPTTPEPAVT